MTEIAFHFNAPDKLAYACRAARKLLRQEKRAVILAPPAMMDALDDTLWRMAPQDFVAHCRADAEVHVLEASPIVLMDELHGAPHLGAPHLDVLLNLSQNIPQGFGSFERVIEIVACDEADRAAARLRWKHYMQRGYALVRYDLAPQGG